MNPELAKWCAVHGIKPQATNDPSDQQQYLPDFHFTPSTARSQPQTKASR